MKVKVTTPMVKLIKEALPKDYEVKLVKLSPQDYKWQVHYDGEYHAMDHGDYDYANNNCKTIKITYPADYYAMPNYITSKDLNDYAKEAKTNNGDITKDSYIKALQNNLLI